MDGIDFDHWDKQFDEAGKAAARHTHSELPKSSATLRLLLAMADADARHFQGAAVRLAGRLAHERDIVWGKDIGALLSYKTEGDSMVARELSEYCHGISMYRPYILQSELRGIFDASISFWKFARGARDNFPELNQWCLWFHGAVMAPGRAKAKVDFTGLKSQMKPYSREVQKAYERIMRGLVHSHRNCNEEGRMINATVTVVRVGNSAQLAFFDLLLKIVCAIEKAITGVKSRLLDSLNLDDDAYARQIVQSQFAALPADELDLLASDPAIADTPSFKELLAKKNQKLTLKSSRPRTKTPPPGPRPLRDDEPVTARLHKKQIAKIFGCGRNNVDQAVLAKVPHRQIGISFEISMAYMPPEYKKKYSRDGKIGEPEVSPIVPVDCEHQQSTADRVTV